LWRWCSAGWRRSNGGRWSRSVLGEGNEASILKVFVAEFEVGLFVVLLQTLRRNDVVRCGVLTCPADVLVLLVLLLVAGFAVRAIRMAEASGLGAASPRKAL